MPQGTIKDYDPRTGTGTLVDDDRTELSFDTETFLASGLEELRLGQRVRFRREGDTVTDLQVVSL
jgi:cold shock CspA family protein